MSKYYIPDDVPPLVHHSAPSSCDTRRHVTFRGQLVDIFRAKQCAAAFPQEQTYTRLMSPTIVWHVMWRASYADTVWKHSSDKPFPGPLILHSICTIRLCGGNDASGLWFDLWLLPEIQRWQQVVLSYDDWLFTFVICDAHHNNLAGIECAQHGEKQSQVWRVRE